MSFKGKEGYYNLWNGQWHVTEIYLKPGDELRIKVDGTHNVTKRPRVRFSGKAKRQNDYLVGAPKYKKQFWKDLSHLERYALSESDFTKMQASIVEARLERLEKFNLPDEMREHELVRIKYQSLGVLLGYEENHRFAISDNDFTTSLEFEKHFNEVDFENEHSFVKVLEYQYFLMEYFQDQVRKGDLSELKALSSDTIRERCAAYAASSIPFAAENYEARVIELFPFIANEETKTHLKEKIAEQNKVPAGTPSIEFNFEDKDGTNWSLNDFKGKVVYLDVWASWCAPCISMMPSFEKLKSKYKDDDVAFLTISVDKPNAKTSWLKKMEELDLTGIQLITDNGFKTDFIKWYEVTSIPRYILLNHEGIVIKAFAPSPNDNRIVEMIDQALEKENN